MTLNDVTRRMLIGLGVLAILSAQQAIALPDLVINKRLLKTSVVTERHAFNTESCDYQEGCITSAGTRKLLRLDVGIANKGTDDLVVGNPDGQPGLFVYSPCHDHYHMKTMIRYRLLNLNYSAVIRARKQAFCLRDNYPFTSWAGESQGYNCDFQGITAGWQDVYDKSLDCQYVDITGVPGGNYYLEVTVNPLHVFAESNYANNTVVVFVSIPYGRSTPQPQPWLPPYVR